MVYEENIWLMNDSFFFLPYPVSVKEKSHKKKKKKKKKLVQDY